MKISTKRISIFITALTIIISLSACGKKEITTQNNNNSEMAENIIYDCEGIKAELTDFSYDGQRVWSIGLKLTNNTENKIGFMADGVTVNSLLCGDAGISIDCEPGTDIDKNIEFDNFDLAYNVIAGGLSKISNIGIQPVITVYKNDSTKEYKYGKFRVIDVDPIEIPIATEAQKQYSYLKKSDKIVFENEQYKVTCLGIAEDFKGIYKEDPHIYFKIENKTDSYIKIRLNEEYESYAEILDSLGADKKAVINGKACVISNFVSKEVCPNTSSIFSQLIDIDDIGIKAEEITSYANKFEIDGYYSYVQEIENVEKCVFPVEVNF